MLCVLSQTAFLQNEEFLFRNAVVHRNGVGRTVAAEGTRVVRAAAAYGAAAPAIPVKDTIKVVRGGLVADTPDRSTLRAVQTPQVFDFDLLRGALKKAQDDGAELTDDCSAVERLGMSVKIVEGDERNLKITTPMDLRIAKMLLEDTL